MYWLKRSILVTPNTLLSIINKIYFSCFFKRTPPLSFLYLLRKIYQDIKLYKNSGISFHYVFSFAYFMLITNFCYGKITLSHGLKNLSFLLQASLSVLTTVYSFFWINLDLHVVSLMVVVYCLIKHLSLRKLKAHHICRLWCFHLIFYFFFFFFLRSQSQSIN